MAVSGICPSWSWAGPAQTPALSGAGWIRPRKLCHKESPGTALRIFSLPLGESALSCPLWLSCVPSHFARALFYAYLVYNVLLWHSSVAVCTPGGFGAATVFESTDPSNSKQREIIKTTLAKVIQTARARLHGSVLLDFMGTTVLKKWKKLRRKMYAMILRPEGCSSIQGEGNTVLMEYEK